MEPSLAAAATRPNLLIIMADEHAPQFSGAYHHPLVQTPRLDQLAAEGVLFERAYCNSPLCVPSRMSFMTGRYVSEIEVWDNATPLRSDIPTWAHALRAVGYDVVLAGKQHFVGPDKRHGFRAQLARDFHGAKAHPIFDWATGTPPAAEPWPALAQAGPGETPEMAADDAAEAAALAYLREPERQTRPWVLNVSFLAPHFPFVVPEAYWRRYPLAAVDLPPLPAGHLAAQHPVYQRLRRMFGLIDFPEELVRRGRAGYYGLITQLDDRIGRLLDALAATGQAERTLVLYLSDHGEMAGEHGLWRKSNFYEHSSRVPLMMRWPGHLPPGRRVSAVVSLVDVVATLIEVSAAPRAGSLAGDSLLPLARGDRLAVPWRDEAFAEYFAHGVARPMAMLRTGRYKLNYSLDDAPELYDLEEDPGEFHDLAAEPAYQPVVEELRARLLARWDPVTLERRVRQSQRERLLIAAAESAMSMADMQRAWYAAGSNTVPT